MDNVGDTVEPVALNEVKLKSEAVPGEIPETTGTNLVRDASGKFIEGHVGMGGRPKGILSIKTLIRQHLEEHPEDLREFVEYFVKQNRELAFQMLEGRPHQSGDWEVRTPKPIIETDVHDNDSIEKNPFLE